jgi:hypothetical protein
MSPQAVAAVYGGLIGGVLATAGVVAGMLIERYLQERGKLRCVLSGWELAEVEPLQRALCSFEVYLFNERILATGLHDVSVAFHLDGEQEVVYPLKRSTTAETLSVLDLPPRRWVHVRPYALFEGQEARKLSAFRRADFVGRLPDGRQFRRTIVARGDFVASQKRSVNARKDYDALPWWRRISGR